MALAGQSSVPQFYQDLVSTTTSSETFLQYLCDARRSQDWGGYGGGSGPEGSDYRQLVVLRALASLGFLDQNGQYVGPPLSPDDQDIQWWMEKFSVPPTDTVGILNMLSDPSPPIRSLGLKKVLSLNRLPDPIVSRLEGIVRSDTYVRMVLLPPPQPPDDDEIILGEGYSDFRAPLRHTAVSILQKHGREDVAVDNFQVALLGLAQMNGFAESGMDKIDIAHALCDLVDPESIGGAIWKEANSSREKYPQYAALFLAWDEATRLGYFSPERGGVNDPNNPVVRHVKARLAATRSAEAKVLINHEAEEGAAQSSMASHEKQSGDGNEQSGIEEEGQTRPHCVWLYAVIPLGLLAVLYFIRRKSKN